MFGVGVEVAGVPVAPPWGLFLVVSGLVGNFKEIVCVSGRKVGMMLGYYGFYG